MDLFSNLLEILAPSPAAKQPVLSQVIDVGSEIALRSIDGEIYNGFVLVPMKGSTPSLVKCKYLLAVTSTQIIELYPHSTKFGVAVAAEVHELQALAKLKFKKGDQGILLLEYKSGKISKILMDDPAVCVSHIKLKMNSVGINGSVRNKSERIVENAQGYFQQAKAIETQFSLSPSVEYVQEMMDLLRRATEKFAEINDEKYMEVMDFIKKFLQRPDVSAVLDASVKTPQKLPPFVTALSTPSESGSALAPNHIQSSSYNPPELELPNIDAELMSLQNALTYHFEEDDQHAYHAESTLLSPATPHVAATRAPPSTAERCELAEMLDKMNMEFDSLLSSFEADVEAIKVSGASETTTAEVQGQEVPEESLPSADGESKIGAEGFLEVDFDQTLQEIVNA